jgi:LmbE family N-acetylglucosaminyl deacetylase
MLKKVLIVAAHPDDEILGCGGAMALHSDKGDKVHVIFMTNGTTSRGAKNRLLDEINQRKQSALDACNIVGAQHPIFLDFPDNQMDACSMLEITQRLEDVINRIEPEIIYTHHSKDLNIDHQLTHQAVMTACRPQPNNFVYEIYSFEVLSSTGWGSSAVDNAFVPNTFIDLNKTWERKMKALHCYEYELRNFPHARSCKGVEALAIYRGVSIGVRHAEAFQLERRLIKNFN